MRGRSVAFYAALTSKGHAVIEAETAQAGISAFCAGYGAGGGIRERVPVYEQFNYLRRACRRFRLRDAGWEAEMTAMLARLD